MPFDLYYMPLSAPCRAVMLTAKAVGVDLNLKVTNLLKGEHMSPDFLKINPQHTIPTLDDNGFYLTESRAICTYLVQRYGKDDTLYPKDSKKRAVIDQRLYFDIGTLYQRFVDYCYPVIWEGATTLDPKKKLRLEEAVQWLEGYLEKTKYVADDHLTLADLVLIASVSTMEATDEHLFDNAPLVKSWIARCKDQIRDYKKLNQEGAEAVGQFFRQALSKVQS